MASYPIDEIEGIGPSYGAKLKEAGLKTTDDFLALCCDPKGRKATAEKTGISEKLILQWANLADLMRISGVGKQFAELLEAAGVDTVKELATRRADNLSAKMKEINDVKKLTKASWNDGTIQGFIDAAKTMDPKVTH